MEGGDSVGDMISRKAAIEAMRECWRRVNQFAKPFEANRIMDCIKAVKDLPAVDAAPVVHGRWIDHKDEHQCSVCKEFTVVDSYVWVQLRYDFCPNCGAKMDGERRDEGETGND